MILVLEDLDERRIGVAFPDKKVQSRRLLRTGCDEQQQQQGDGGSTATLAEFRGLLKSTDASQGAPHGRSDKVLQQFMNWRQKAGTGATSQ